jgi:5,6-dimethylbenzimidazole synthase
MTAANSCAPTFDDAFRSQLQALFRWRRDVRRFQTTPIAATTVACLLETASLAPSVGLSQPWRFVLVDAPERRAAVRANFEHCNADALAHQSQQRAGAYARLKLAGFDEAPCHLAVFADPDPSQGHGLGRRTMPETAAYSAVMAIHTLWLAARVMGLGLGWVSILEPGVVSDILDIPRHWIFIGYLCLGYPQAENDLPELQQAGWEQMQPVSATLLQR